MSRYIDYDEPDFTETRWFKNYCTAIERLFKKHPYVTRPLINREVGYEHVRVIDVALERLGVIETGIIGPVRYVLAPRLAPRPRRSFNGWKKEVLG